MNYWKKSERYTSESFVCTRLRSISVVFLTATSVPAATALFTIDFLILALVRDTSKSLTMVLTTRKFMTSCGGHLCLFDGQRGHLVKSCSDKSPRHAAPLLNRQVYWHGCSYANPSFVANAQERRTVICHVAVVEYTSPRIWHWVSPDLSSVWSGILFSSLNFSQHTCRDCLCYFFLVSGHPDCMCRGYASLMLQWFIGMPCCQYHVEWLYLFNCFNAVNPPLIIYVTGRDGWMARYHRDSRCSDVVVASTDHRNVQDYISSPGVTK